MCSDFEGLRRTLLVERWPPVHGRPGITQGSYGRAGNLELVVPDVDDGLWVGWYNCDADDDHRGAAVRRWSGALRFARGRAYDTADVTQAPDGSLETVALDRVGRLVRHVWTTAEGYTERGVVADGVRSHSPIVVSGFGSRHVVVVDAAGVAELLTMQPNGEWDPEPMGRAEAAHAAQHEGHVDVLLSDVAGAWRLLCPSDPDEGDATGRVVSFLRAEGSSRLLLVQGAEGLTLTAPGRGEVRLTDSATPTAGAAVVHLDGHEFVDLVVQDQGVLTHVRVGSGRFAHVSSELVRSEVWVEPGTRSSHRTQ